MPSSRPRVAHVRGTTGRGGVPEVADQLLDRLRAAGVGVRLVPAQAAGHRVELVHAHRGARRVATSWDAAADRVRSLDDEVLAADGRAARGKARP